MSETEFSTVHLPPISRGEIRGGDTEALNKKLKELVTNKGALADITWHTATLNAHTRQIIAEGTRSDGTPYELTIHAGNTINNTVVTSAEGSKRIADTATTIATLGFGIGGDDMTRYRHVLTRLTDETSGLIITFGGLMDRRVTL